MIKNHIGYQEAIEIKLNNSMPLAKELAPLTDSAERVAARGLPARANFASVTEWPEHDRYDTRTDRDTWEQALAPLRWH